MSSPASMWGDCGVAEHSVLVVVALRPPVRVPVHQVARLAVPLPLYNFVIAGSVETAALVSIANAQIGVTGKRCYPHNIHIIF